MKPTVKLELIYYLIKKQVYKKMNKLNWNSCSWGMLCVCKMDTQIARDHL